MPAVTVEIDTDTDSDTGTYVSVSAEYLSDLIRAKRELRELKAQRPAVVERVTVEHHHNVSPEYLATYWPELVELTDTDGTEYVSLSDLMDRYPEYFEGREIEGC